MKLTFKQILAWIGIFLIAALYLSALILSFFSHPAARTMFWVSIVSTIAVPVMIHLFLMMKNVKQGKGILDDPYHKKESDRNS